MYYIIDTYIHIIIITCIGCSYLKRDKRDDCYNKALRERNQLHTYNNIQNANTKWTCQYLINVFPATVNIHLDQQLFQRSSLLFSSLLCSSLLFINNNNTNTFKSLSLSSSNPFRWSIYHIYKLLLFVLCVCMHVLPLNRIYIQSIKKFIVIQFPIWNRYRHLTRRRWQLLRGRYAYNNKNIRNKWAYLKKKLFNSAYF